jgi:hypothetical protein
MKATDIVRAIMKTNGIKIAALADKLKIRSNVISVRLTQDNISISKLDEMLRLMDYKIVVVPRDTTEKEGWYRAE